jgi:hypothetical protein
MANVNVIGAAGNVGLDAPPSVLQAAAKGPQYTLKGVKTFRGMDGYGLNAKLCRDGKEVAFLLDEGCGGMLDFDWKDRMHGESVEEDIFKAFIEQERAKIPADKVDEHGMNEREYFGGEMWVNALVDSMANAKRMKLLCKTKTCYQVGEQIGGEEFFVVKGVDPKIRSAIEKKHADKKVKFMNDEFGA